MMNMYSTMFYTSMIMGSVITVSSYSWMGMWMGLEINLLSIIPLISQSKTPQSSESALKYFITQAIASSIIIFSLITMNLMESPSQIPQVGMFIALALKAGAAPLHFWLPEVMEGLDWLTALIMLTWQKIAPMMIITNLKSLESLLTLVAIISMTIGGIMGFNQTSLRKILAYSSINHIGWMLISLSLSMDIWMVYFIVYSVISLTLILAFKFLGIFHFNQIQSSPNTLLKMTLLVNFLSMGGMPPFLGFLPKWVTLNAIVSSAPALAMIMVLLSLIALFYYMRILLPSSTLTGAKLSAQASPRTYFYLWMINGVSLLSLTICTAWFSMS